MAEKESDYRVPALQRGLSILEMFSASVRSLSMQEIADGLGVSLSSIYRIVQTLHDMGYLKKIGKHSYALGPKVISQGFTWLASRDLVDIAAPWLNDLRDRCSLSCHLSIREQTDNLYIYRAFAAQRLSVNVPIGTRLPCHCTAMGRVLLSALNAQQIASLYQAIRLDDYPAPAPKTLPELLQLVDEDRRNGHVIHRSDYSTAIACAIRDHTGSIVAAINLSGPDAVMDSATAQDYFLASLQGCAQAISAELGHIPAP